MTSLVADRIGGLVFLALQVSVTGQGVEPGATRERRRAEAERVAIESLPSVLVGRVVGPDGTPVEGAVVVSSAGGRALTDALGNYRLEVEVPLDASGVRVTAVARNGGASLSAVSEIVMAGAGTTPTGTLFLEPDACCEPAWLPAFGTNPGVGGFAGSSVLALVVFDDGSGPALHVGGQFWTAGALAANHVARWNGSSWSTLGSGMDSWISALAVHDDGSGPALYAGGAFTAAGGVTVNHVARWNGSSWSALGSGTDTEVRALASFDDGGGPALYAAGAFTTAGGVAASRIAKWDGSSWSALGTGLGYDAHSIASFDDGAGPALYVGGEFTSAGGTAANRIARWNGTSWSALGGGLTGGGYPGVAALAVFDDGGGPELYAGGAFTDAGGTSAFRIAKWDGSSWSAVGGGFAGGGGLGPVVRALTVFDEGSGPNLYAGGNFTSAGGIAASRVAKWNGSAWSPLAATGGGANDDVRALVSFDGGNGPRLHAGGEFTRAGGVTVGGIASWTGTRWTTLGLGLNAGVHALAVLDDGSGPVLCAGGEFTTAGGVAANHVARWDGTSWSALGSGRDDPVLALAVFDDGGGPALYASRAAVAPSGGETSLVSKWDGASWVELDGMGTGSVWVEALAAHDDGNGPALYAGGFFLTAGGVSVHHIAKWDGTSWSPLGSGMSGGTKIVLTMAEYDDGGGPALYAGGTFTIAGGVTVNYVARWDGTSWSALGGGVNEAVAGLAVFDDGSGPSLYAAGYFTTAGGVAANRIARWDGSSWSAVGGGVGDAPLALTVIDDESGPALYAGGSFTVAGGVAANRIARWDGSSWSPLGSGFANSVEALAVFDDGVRPPVLCAGGGFLIVPDSGDSFLGEWGCLDSVAPTISAPARVLAADDRTGPSGEIVNFVVTASDACDPAPSVVCVPPSGSFFPRGTTMVTCTATDAAGNQSTCSFPVVVSVPPRRR